MMAHFHWEDNMSDFRVWLAGKLDAILSSGPALINLQKLMHKPFGVYGELFSELIDARSQGLGDPY